MFKKILKEEAQLLSLGTIVTYNNSKIIFIIKWNKIILLPQQSILEKEFKLYLKRKTIKKANLILIKIM